MLQSTLGGKDAEVALYHLTRAYQALADHSSRETYDQSLGLNVEPLPRVPLTRRSSWNPFSSRVRDAVEPDIKIDYYEVMRLDSAAHLAVVGEAYAVMRNHYLRLAEQGQARAELVDLLEEAYSVLADPVQRHEYDTRRNEGRPAHSTNGASGDAAPASEKAAPSSKVLSATGGREMAVGHPLITSFDHPTTARRDENGRAREPRWANTTLRPSAAEQALPHGKSAAEQSEDGTRSIEQVSGQPETAARESSTNAQLSDHTVTDYSLRLVGVMTRLVNRLVVVLAALLIKAGKGSVQLTRAASRTLSQVLRPPRSGNDGAPYEEEEEEEALLSRLFVTVADNSKDENSDGPRVLARLTIFTGDEAIASHDVRRVPLTLGDGDACDLKLAGLASPQARLLYHGGQFVLHALTDDPAARIHGCPVSWALLRDGDSFEVGPYRLHLSLTQ